MVAGKLPTRVLDSWILLPQTRKIAIQCLILWGDYAWWSLHRVKINLRWHDYCICMSYTPLAYEYGTRPFLRWVWSQGGRSDVSGSPQNALGSVGIPLFGAAQASGNKPNYSEEGLGLGRRPPEVRSISNDETHPTEPYSALHGRPKHVPPTGKNVPL